MARVKAESGDPRRGVRDIEKARALCEARAARLTAEGRESSLDAARARGWAAALRWVTGHAQPKWFEGEE
ncbi:MAG: hypothetical protein M0R06_17695 [Sphaerochaeta sp.]|jgi:hypothetical protein|nr:hypothetical protein [Sphaerochaeta sp.]